jgi:hypothetical protein
MNLRNDKCKWVISLELLHTRYAAVLITHLGRDKWVKRNDDNEIIGADSEIEWYWSANSASRKFKSSETCGHPTNYELE